MMGWCGNLDGESWDRKEGYQRSDISDQEAKKQDSAKAQKAQRLAERRKQRTQRRGEKSKEGRRKAARSDEKQIPPLRGPTRQNAAREKKSGRSGRDDNLG